jgi:HAD superfamily hydrolase (TIGR01490 family)
VNNSAAFFDVDGTIAKGDIVRHYVYLRTSGMNFLQKTLWKALFLFKVPRYIILDKLSRYDFSCAFYRNYVNLKPPELKDRTSSYFQKSGRKSIYPAALEQVQQHQHNGDMVVLVTNSLREIVEPLAQHLQVSELIAPQLEKQENRFTGALLGGPLTDHRKAQAVARFAREHGLDLDQCYAYADSLDDVPMLESVGNPKAINPDRNLRRIAQRKGWEVFDWPLTENCPPPP